MPDKDDEGGLIKAHGLSLLVAGVFLAGEMAGTGVLALPHAMVGTGWGGLFVIAFFGLNSAFVGTRLGLCWIILEERYPEYRGQVRDPYPCIAERAAGKLGRNLASTCISLTQYGTICVFIVIMGDFAHNLSCQAGFQVSSCAWMAVVALLMCPLCWFGTPNDFWLIAFGALATTLIGCTMVMTRISIDIRQDKSCYYNYTDEDIWRPFNASEIDFPAPTAGGFFAAFGTIMYAFAGAATFPTVQADMKDRRQFPLSALLAVTILVVLYLPMSAVGYHSLGNQVANNVVDSLCNGPVKIVVEVLLLLHVVAAFPMQINPSNQHFEEILNIPKSFTWKRVVFRSAAILILLFISETIPNFGSILDLIGGSTITLLSFVFPPFFYMRLVDMSPQNPEWNQRSLQLWDRIYCWFVMAIGVAGGVAATFFAIKNIASDHFTPPCYIQDSSGCH